MTRTPITAARTRRELIDAGVLLDVTRLARQHRITVPAAITAAAWTTCGSTTTEFATPTGDVLAHRILQAAFDQAAHSRPSALANPALGFALEDAGARHIVELELTVGPGDDGEPVVTIDLATY